MPLRRAKWLSRSPVVKSGLWITDRCFPSNFTEGFSMKRKPFIDWACGAPEGEIWRTETGSGGIRKGFRRKCSFSHSGFLR